MCDWQNFRHYKSLPIIEDHQAPVDLATAPGDDNEETESDAEPVPQLRKRRLVLGDTDEISVASAHSEDDEETVAPTGKEELASQKGAPAKKPRVQPPNHPLHLSSAIRKTVEAERRAKAVAPTSSSAATKPQKKKSLSFQKHPIAQG